MKFLTVFFIVLYLVHVLFSNGLLEFNKFDFENIMNRILLLSYVTMLALANVIENPNTENFIIAFVFSFGSCFGYAVKFMNNKDRIHYVKQNFYHVFLLLTPLLFVIFNNKINWKKYNITIISFIAICYIVFLKLYNNQLYKNGIPI